MGVVYRARDPRLARDVALKLVARGDLDESQARLEREAQAMAKLSHRNVAIVHDIGTWRGQLFIAMELCSGGSLGRWLREAPRPWAEVTRRFIAAGRGLDAAHQLGLVHRDFKPDNVLIGAGGVIKVSDFGLASTIRGDDAPAAGAIEGTPVYMAPEQLEGGVVDARADQFAFAVALWEGLYGMRPFVISPAAPAPLAALLVEIRARRWHRADGREVPRRLRDALERALAPAPAERWPNLTALLDELDAIIAPERTRWWIGAVAASTVIAVVATVVAVREQPARRPAEVSSPSPGALVHAASLAYAGAAEVWRGLGDRVAAEAAWREASRLAGDVRYYLPIAQMKDAAHDCVGAIAAYRVYGADYPSANLTRYLGQIKEICDAQGDPKMFEAKADAAWNRGDTAGTIEALQYALTASDDIYYVYRLAVVEWETGDCQPALDGFRVYLQRGKDIPDGVRSAIAANEETFRRTKQCP
jgi:hypothetical protein